MINDTDLPQQPDTIHPPPLMKKKSKPTWTGFFTLLIILHLPLGLPFGWDLAYLVSNMPSPTVIDANILLNLANIVQRRFPLLLPLAIIDFIAIISYIKKQSPPWIVFFISLFAANVIFFNIAAWALNQSAGGVEALGIIPIALSLLIIDLTAILFYIIRPILRTWLKL